MFVLGVRLAIHAANRLIHEDGKYACIAACAAGGQVKWHLKIFPSWHHYLVRGTVTRVGSFLTILSMMPTLRHPTFRVLDVGDSIIEQYISGTTNVEYFFPAGSWYACRALS